MTNNEKIFLSYTRSDEKFALKLAGELRSYGADIWIDQTEISGGLHWDLEIEKALLSATIVLVMISEKAIQSKHVMDEISFALDENKRVIPVLLSSCKLPLRLRRLHYIDFSRNYNEGLSELIQIIDTNPNKPITHKQESHETSAGFKKQFTFQYLLFLALIVLLAIVCYNFLFNNPGPTKQNTATNELKPDSQNSKSSGESLNLNKKLLDSQNVRKSLRTDKDEKRTQSPVEQSSSQQIEKSKYSVPSKTLQQQNKITLTDFPSVFTPNGDGKNDVFLLLNRRNFEEFELTIYNRWGMAIFKTNTPMKSWDGTYKEKLQNADKFYWQLKYRFPEMATIEIVKGEVLLIQ